MNLFSDSFATTTALLQKWQLGTGNIISPGRFDNFAYDTNSQHVTRNLGTNAGTLYAGFALLTPSAGLGGSSNQICAFQDSTNPSGTEGTNQVGLVLNSTGTFQVKSNGTNLGSASTAALAFGAWHYIEIGVTISATVGTVTVKLDGVSIISLTGQNTKASSNSTANQFWMGFNIATHTQFDDVYVNDNTGSFNNSFLGDIKVIGSTPTGNGTLSQYTNNAASWVASSVMAVGATILDSNSNLQRITAVTGDAKTGTLAPTWNVTTGGTTTDNHVTWTNLGAMSAYKLVNETSPDDDSSYLSDATIGDQARFTFPAVFGSGVLAVAVYGRARKDDANARSIRFVAESGGTVADNGSDFTLSSGYQNFRAVFETDPNTSTAWTASTVNSAEFGVKTTA